MDTSTSADRLDPRRREAHPERIELGDETLERDDITAKRMGQSQRSMTKLDRLGAPRATVAGVKYRPVRRFERFMLSRIQEGKPEALNAKRRRAR